VPGEEIQRAREDHPLPAQMFGVAVSPPGPSYFVSVVHGGILPLAGDRQHSSVTGRVGLLLI